MQKPKFRFFTCLAVGISVATPNVFAVEGFTNTPFVPGTPWHMHDPARPQPRVVTPGATFSQGVPAPADSDSTAVAPLTVGMGYATTTCRIPEAGSAMVKSAAVAAWLVSKSM